MTPKYYVNYKLTEPGLEAAFSAPETRRGWAENAVRERLARPERAGAFQIAWMDDTGRARVNMGYFAAYPSLPGRSRCIFRGGLTQDEIARRALRLMLTGALCGGGAWMVCGADVDAHTLSNAESMRFCRAFADGLGELPADDAIFDALLEIFTEHQAVPLILNGEPIGDGLWIIEGIDEGFEVVNNKGVAIALEVPLKLKEYVEAEGSGE